MSLKTVSQIRSSFEGIREKSLELRHSKVSKRKEKLANLEKWVLTNRDAICLAVYKDLQKPTEETEITEIFVVLSEIRKTKRNIRRWTREQPVKSSLTYLGTKASIKHEPKGACLIISPWNYPFQLAIKPLISAIAAGNTAIIKPSEFSEHTSFLIKKMCEEVFLEDEVTVILGEVSESQELLKLPFDHIFFTGSPQVGKIVMEAAAKNLTSVTLELGGKSPTIVDETANIKDAAKKICWAKWQNAGQICVAPDYLMVQENVKDKLIKEMVVQSVKRYGSERAYGGIINRHHHNRINDLMADAIEKGADIEFGGKSDRAGLRFTPTLLSNLSRESRVLHEEIFGPILPLITFQELEEVVQYINEKPKPLALYLFTRSKKSIDFIKKATSAGMMTINDAVLQFAHPNLPIGGVNNSGIGKASGYYGFLEFTNKKAILKQRNGFTMVKTLYPPYSKAKRFMINFMVKYF